MVRSPGKLSLLVSYCKGIGAQHITTVLLTSGLDRHASLSLEVWACNLRRGSELPCGDRDSDKIAKARRCRPDLVQTPGVLHGRDVSPLGRHKSSRRTEKRDERPKVPSSRQRGREKARTSTSTQPEEEEQEEQNRRETDRPACGRRVDGRLWVLSSSQG